MLLRRLRQLLFRDERACAAVEFTFLLPFLLVVLLGTIDFGRFAFAAISVSNAARSGAAYCLYDKVTCSPPSSDSVNQIMTIVDNEASFIPLDASLVTVSVDAATAGCPCIIVTVRFEFRTLVPLPAIGVFTGAIPASVWIVREARMPIGI